MTYPPQQPPYGPQPGYPPPQQPPQQPGWTPGGATQQWPPQAPHHGPHQQPAPPYPPQQYPPQQGPPQQGPYPEHPQQQGPLPPRPEHRAGGRRRWLEPSSLIAVATLVVGLVLGWLIGRHVAQPDTLDPTKVEAGVTTVLRDDYGVANVSGMSCPNHMTVQTNATYTCTFSAGSAKGSVDIIVRNDAGQYQVQGPRG